MTTQPSKPTPKLARLEEKFADLAASYPQVTLHRPWGHQAFKVASKTFLFLSADGTGLSFSLKLPLSRTSALELPFTEPTHYGLGRSGWVTASLRSADDLPIETFKAWLQESYCAIAPKKLSAQVQGAKALAESAATRRSTASKNAASKGIAPKKAIPKTANAKKPSTKKSTPKRAGAATPRRAR